MDSTQSRSSGIPGLRSVGRRRWAMSGADMGLLYSVALASRPCVSCRSRAWIPSTDETFLQPRAVYTNMQTASTSAFVGSVPENYDQHMGPMYFRPYAIDIA